MANDTAKNRWKSLYSANGMPAPRPEDVMNRILNPYEDTDYRVPFMFNSSMRIGSAIPPVRMKVNPASVSFSQNKRITRRDTQSGAVFFHWCNEKGRNNDVINISFSGKTGNINLRSGASRQNWASDGLRKWRDKLKSATIDGNAGSMEPEVVAGATKLTNFLNLYSHTREPMYDPISGKANQFYILYSSPLFANALITFIGHYDRVMEFSEEANDPFNPTYSFSFVATDSVPSMDDVYKYVSSMLGRSFFNELG